MGNRADAFECLTRAKQMSHIYNSKDSMLRALIWSPMQLGDLADINREMPP